MKRDPARVRQFLSRFAEWHRVNYGTDAPRIRPALFWVLHSLLVRMDAILSRMFGGRLKLATVSGEDFLIQMADNAKASGARCDLGLLLRSWRGLAVRVGIKPEWIQSTEPRRARKRGKVAA